MRCFRPEGTYSRRELYGDVLYWSFRFKGIRIVVSKKPGVPVRVTDTLADAMVREGLITPQTRAAYNEAAVRPFGDPTVLAQCHNFTQEELYEYLHGIRLQVFGAEAIEAMHTRLAQTGIPFDPTGNIDQRSLKGPLAAKCKTVVFALFEAEFFPTLVRDLEALAPDRAVILTSPHRGQDLPHRDLIRQWLNRPVEFLEAGATMPEDCCIFAYGEEGLLQCRGLGVPAFAQAIPRGFCAQALANDKPCAIYIPQGLDLTPLVPLRDRSKLTYRQLYALWRDHGMGIYDLDLGGLYRTYPQYFLNIYGPELPPDFPIRLPECTPETFVAARESAPEAFLNQFPGIDYRYAYFDEDLGPQPMATDGSAQPGILVHSIRVQTAKGARVISCDGNLRKAMEQERRGIVSNFLFFLTAKLGDLYNHLRADRPYEQADAARGHLDYMLTHREGKRIETFPLFQKSCFAKTREGKFFFFRFRLGGGQVTLGNTRLRWERDQVDPEIPGDIAVYTPLATASYEGDQNFTLAVGRDRLNLVILQDRLWVIRKGDVLLPSVGVVISLAADHPLANTLTPLKDGYYQLPPEPLTVHLDPPEGIDPGLWDSVEWAYGGGLTLVDKGMGLCDGEDMQTLLTREGWLSPASMQTQESSLHTLVKHPRTAIGLTKTGELLLLVYSGRTWRSSGADYREMIAIARQLYPDLWHLMNMDGGGSAFLGLVEQGNLLELSFPSTSSGSCAGQVRPVSTVLYIPIEE